MERLNLKKLNEVQVENNIGFKSEAHTLHENSDDDKHINRAWETITQNIKISAKESSLSRSNGTSQTVVATGSKQNKWR
jgi:hypothetical protein